MNCFAVLLISSLILFVSFYVVIFSRLELVARRLLHLLFTLTLIYVGSKYRVNRLTDNHAVFASNNNSDDVLDF